MHALKKTVLAGILTVFYLCLLAQPQPNIIRFGVIADPQYADKDSYGKRQYRNSLLKLDTAVSYLNGQQLAFNIVLGDLVDQGIKDLPPVMERLSKLQQPLYNILGNHDYVNAPDREQLYTALKMPAPYYSFEKNNWVFIVLNTNELSEYATQPGTDLHNTWKILSDTLKAAGRKNCYEWNGGISKKQLYWMESCIKKAKRKSKNVILFSHHPLLPENGLEALNNREILAVIAKYNNVRAAISGHHHAGNYAEFKGIPIITIEGMVDTEQNAYGVITLYDNTIEIEGSGRCSSRKLDK